MSGRNDPRPEGSGNRTFHWVLGWYLLVGAFFLLASHQAHWFALAACLLLLSCPLMILLLHRERDRAPGAPEARAGGTARRPDDRERRT